MEKNKDKTAQIIVLILVGLVALVLVVNLSSSKQKTPAIAGAQDQVEEFAVCIANSGAKMYGASWCSHCEDQKEDFNNSESLPYTECSTADGKGQTAICAAEGIASYPTWRFGDGQEKSGALSFSQLAEYTGCAEPI